MFDQIADCLRADEKVTIAGFGRFEMRPRKPKAYTNPKTKVSSQLESTSIPGFKASGRFQNSAVKMGYRNARRCSDIPKFKIILNRPALRAAHGIFLFLC